MTIRAATEKDLPEILEIYNEVILHTTAVYDYTAHTLEMRKEWFRSRQEQGLPVLVAEEAGKVLGFASFGPFRAWAAYQYTVENLVHVHSEHRGKGVARQLMEALIAEARKMGKHTMVAGIDADNAASIALHRRFGFEVAGHFRQVGYKFDRWLDLVFMQLIL